MAPGGSPELPQSPRLGLGPAFASKACERLLVLWGVQGAAAVVLSRRNAGEVFASRVSALRAVRGPGGLLGSASCQGASPALH